jgi:endoribonuclease Nob1
MICDTSVLLHSDFTGQITTVHEVLDEIKTKKHRGRLEFREIRVLEPESAFVERIEEEAKKAGLGERLSKTDKKLLALALQTGDILLTDDYAIQKLAKIMKIKCKPFQLEGIR